MGGGIIDIGALDLALATGFILAAGALSLVYALGFTRSLLVATARTYLQLLALGYALGWVFDVDRWWVVENLLEACFRFGAAVVQGPARLPRFLSFRQRQPARRPVGPQLRGFRDDVRV